MEDYEKYIQGVNPWTGDKFVCILADAPEDFSKYPEEVRNIMYVYFFYMSCATRMMSELSSNKDNEIFVDEDSEYMNLGYPTPQIKTVAYFGSDYIRKTLKDYEGAYKILKAIAKLNIKKDNDRDGISILYKNTDDSSPFPKIEPIN